MSDDDPYQSLTFDKFRALASDESLSKYGKIGFPDSYREGHEKAIFQDILTKIPNLARDGARVLDIGPGCSDLPRMLLELCRQKGHQLTVVDSLEMLDLLPHKTFVEKIEGPYPQCKDCLSSLRGKVDAMICYSVFHYIFVEASTFDFLDTSLELLNSGGQCIIGDIPNYSKRRRFFASEAGKAFHRAFTGTDGEPDFSFNTPLPGMIDDSVIFALLKRARDAGCDAYVMPQPDSLPMANRREDVLIFKP